MCEKAERAACLTPRLPNLCFVARTVGELSETWLWRQIVGFKQIKAYVFTWDYRNRDVFPLANVPVTIFPVGRCWPEERNTLARWIYRLWNLPKLNFYAMTARESRAIARAMLEVRPDVALCQYGPMSLRILEVARRINVPLVGHFHGYDLSSALRNRWYRWSLTNALCHFAAVVVVNARQKRWLIERGVPEKRLHVIPCGVPTGLFKPIKERNSETIQFITVSRLVEKKGVDYSLHAFARVVAACPLVRLVIIGDGPLRGYLENLARELGIERYASFVGMVRPEKVRSYFQEAHVFIQHSVISSRGDMEGWPVSIAEAAAFGLPVVTTLGCGGTEEQVVEGKTGFLVPQRDVNAMAERMLELARNPDLRKRFGEAAREHMVQEFDTEKQVAKLEAVLLGIATKQ